MKYDIIHFEALGKEAKYLKYETINALNNGLLPRNFNYLITQDTIQTFLEKYPDIELPKIISTKTHSILPESYLKGEKKSIITRSAGYDHFEHLINIINLTSLRDYCVQSVAQTAIKFLYASAGKLNEYIQKTQTFERNKISSFIELTPTKIATVFGVGKIGIEIYRLLKANNLTVQAVDIRESELGKLYKEKINFVSKEEALKNSDIIINAMNLTKNKNSHLYNVNYFSELEFSKVKKDLIFINVTRGEIAPEETLLKYYKKGIISGLGLDVFSNENLFSLLLNNIINTKDPNLIAGKEIVNKALAREENFYVQPHQGFNSDIAALNKAKEAIKHVCNWYKNKCEKFDEQLPYYN